MNITYRQMFAANCTISGIMGFTFSFVGIPWYYGAILSVPIGIFTYLAWADIFYKEEKTQEKPPHNPKGKVFLSFPYNSNAPVIENGRGYGDGASIHTLLWDTEYQKEVLSKDLKDIWWFTEERIGRMPFIPTEFVIYETHQ